VSENHIHDIGLPLHVDAVVDIERHGIDLLFNILKVPDTKVGEGEIAEGAGVIRATGCQRQVIAGMLAGGSYYVRPSKCHFITL
jgi:hypothetical protein